MTQRLAPLRDALALVTTLAVAAVAGCQRSSPITEPGSVASVTVSPATLHIDVGQSAQLAATPRDRNGNSLSGRPVTWATSDAAVATVDGAGRVTGVTAGSATITATSEGVRGTATVTVTAPPPPSSGSCLDQTGPSLTLSGLQTSAFDNRNLAPSTKLDAATAQFTTPALETIYLAGGANICWSGGQVIGRFPPSTSWDTMHDSYGMIAHQPSFQLENYRAFNQGKGVSYDGAEDTDWSVRGIYVKYNRDDCVENDFLNSGTIDDSFFDGCYSGVSAQRYAASMDQDGHDNLVTMKNSLMRMQTMDAAYSGAVPNGNPFWKWDDLGPKLALYNNVFRADARAREDLGIRETMVPPNLVDCSNNVMIWLGPGAFPYSYPATFNGKTCFTILTGQVGLAYWNAAVANWTARHPFTQQDIAAPIVSLFSPGVVGDTILTGAVTLVATAVDDVGVVGVQFQLNGQNIGAEQLVNTAYQPADSRNWDLMHKYTLSWNSAAVSNGSYLLTAVARDAAGNSTTSGGVRVTISN